jgi:hypothetical protein
VRKRMTTAGLPLLVAPMMASGCGGSSGGGGSKPAASAAAEGPAPPQLVGAYAMSLKPSDLPPHPPEELTGGSAGWTLKVANSGGPGGGPVFTVANDQSGTLESSSLGVAGERVFLHHEECAEKTGYRLVESEYRWSLSGKTLRLSDVKVGCPDKVASTILTSERWTKGRWTRW